MSSFLNFFRKQDFYLHFVACLIVAIIVATVVAHLAVGLPLAAIVAGFLAAFFTGWAKEFADSRQPGNFFSWSDMFADLLGAAVGSQIGWVALLI
ncbi:MAG: hypothetical protein J1E33_05615 [Alistipes sp.]|nr:hypothetical protein [Alistipes sp.]